MHFFAVVTSAIAKANQIGSCCAIGRSWSQVVVSLSTHELLEFLGDYWWAILVRYSGL